MTKMIPKEKVKSNISLSTHPLGIERFVEKQFEFTEKQKKFEGPKNVLILGGSAGYGLSTRVALTVGAGSKTISVSLNHYPSDRRPMGNPAFWGQNAFTKIARQKGYESENIFCNVFEDESKEIVIKRIKETFKNGKVDLLVYSIAAPKRKDPKTGVMYSSSLKTLAGEYTGSTIDVAKQSMNSMTVTAATQDEIDNTIKVMGGEDWALWVKKLKDTGTMSDKFRTIAYTYLGSKMTDPIYRNGTIGKAKEHLEKTARELTEEMKKPCSIVSLKAVVTAASVFIPTFPIYASALMKVMKEKGTDEGTIEQVYRFYSTMYYGSKPIIDDKGYYRADNLEMDLDTQEKVEKIMSETNQENFMEKINAQTFIEMFYNVNGFRIKGIDYDQEIDLAKIIEKDIRKEMK